MKALIIDEPWISLILQGRKVWEMRKTACHYRGPIALIRKGSGLVVGTANLIDSLPALDTLATYAEAEPRHQIPPQRQQLAFSDGWRRPWVLRDARALSKPVRYRHPSGAVIWVNLDGAVAAAVEAQPDISVDAAAPAEPRPVISTLASAPRHPSRDAAAVPASAAGAIRDVVLTSGNLRNNHIYLPLDFFPADAIGGRNKALAAVKTITVTFRPGATIATDIDPTKRILRARAPVGDFLARAGLGEGDRVRIACTGPYSYAFSKACDD